MLVKELKGVISNRYLVYKIKTQRGFCEQYYVIPQFFYEYEVLDCYFHHNEFVDMLDVIVRERGVTKK